MKSRRSQDSGKVRHLLRRNFFHNSRFSDENLNSGKFSCVPVDAAQKNRRMLNGDLDDEKPMN